MLAANIGFAPFDTDWLRSVLILTAPILLAALGELISERAGVLNVGLEGMMLVGAFFSYWIAWSTHSLALGLLAGVAAGLALAAVMALLTVQAGADQIVSGVGINLAAIGLTGFLFDRVFADLRQQIVDTISPLPIPLLSSLPVVGDALFNQDPVLYFAFLLVPVIWFLLYRTRWGLSIRAAGEMPAAADTAGISVRLVRWMGVLAAGALSGLGGAYLAIVVVGIFRQQMTAGRGFLALVVVIFGRWRPLGVLGACLIIGGSDALQLRLADRSELPRVLWAAIALIAAAYLLYQLLVRRGRTRWRAFAIVAVLAAAGLALFAVAPSVALPIQVWRALPFLIALAVLGGAATRAHMPAQLTIHYRRGER